MTFLSILVGGVVAAIVSGYLLRQLKISEFRQAWINDLRTDIAEYVGTCIHWRVSLAYLASLERKLKAPIPGGSLELTGQSTMQDDLNAIKEELDLLTLQSIKLLAKIKLRINPGTSQDECQDTAFLLSLEGFAPKDAESEKKADISVYEIRGEECIQQGRLILKREWEATKNPWQRYFRLPTIRNRT